MFQITVFYRSDHEYEETGSEEDVEEPLQEVTDEANDTLVGNEKKQNGEYRL